MVEYKGNWSPYPTVALGFKHRSIYSFFFFLWQSVVVQSQVRKTFLDVNLDVLTLGRSCTRGMLLLGPNSNLPGKNNECKHSRPGYWLPKQPKMVIRNISAFKVCLRAAFFSRLFWTFKNYLNVFLWWCSRMTLNCAADKNRLKTLRVNAPLVWKG